MDCVVKDYIELLRIAYERFISKYGVEKYDSYEDFSWDLVCNITHNMYEGNGDISDYKESLATRGVFTDVFLDYCRDNDIDVAEILKYGALYADSFIREAIFYKYLEDEVKIHFSIMKQGQ